MRLDGLRSNSKTCMVSPDIMGIRGDNNWLRCVDCVRALGLAGIVGLGQKPKTQT